jgi:hypothetical protein
VVTRGLTPAAATAASSEIVARTVAIDLDFPAGMVRINGSPASLVIGGAEYIGVGGLGGISAAEESAELQAYGITVSLSGIPRDAVALALGQAYQGRRATVWEVLLNRDTWQPIADPVIVFRGRMDQMNIAMGQTATVEVRLENRLVDWERPRIRRYTSEDQHLAHPQDRGFEFVSDTMEREVVWPAGSFVPRSPTSRAFLDLIT